MQRPSQQLASGSPFSRSRLTNGRLPIDGRSIQARRFRDLMRGYEGEFEIISELDRALVRTAATLSLKIEEMEAAQLRGEPMDAGDLTRLAGERRRTLADLRRRGEATSPAPINLFDQLAANADENEDND